MKNTLNVFFSSKQLKGASAVCWLFALGAVGTRCSRGVGGGGRGACMSFVQPGPNEKYSDTKSLKGSRAVHVVLSESDQGMVYCAPTK